MQREGENFLQSLECLLQNFSVFWLFTAYQILDLCQEKDQIARKVHDIIDKFAERGLRSLAVAYQVISMIPFIVPFLLKGSLNEEKDVNVAYL